MRNLFGLLMTGFLSMCAVAPANAQLFCTKYEEFKSILLNKHREVSVLTALMNDGTVLEIFKSQNGNWTAAKIRPDGIACALADGEAMEIFKDVKFPEKKEQEDPA